MKIGSLSLPTPFPGSLSHPRCHLRASGNLHARAYFARPAMLSQRRMKDLLVDLTGRFGNQILSRILQLSQDNVLIDLR